jgi:hypothetical protein
MSTYSQIYIQAIFAVKGRESLIRSEWEDLLYKYIACIVNNTTPTESNNYQNG